MKVRLSSSPSALMGDWEVYGYIDIASEAGSMQTIAFAGGAGAASSTPYRLPPTTTSKEFIVNLRGIPLRGSKIAYVNITVIGFTLDLTTTVDYLDFSELPFEKVAGDAIFIP